MTRDPRGRRSVSDGGEADLSSRAALEAAMRMLARRALSESEIGARLEKKGFPTSAAEAAIGRLRELGLSDDPGLCRRLAVHYRESRGYGSAKIAWTLRKRGFRRDLVEEAMKESCTADDEIEAAAAALRKKFRDGLPAGRDGAARAYRFLAGRGFSPAACRKALGRLPKDIQEGEDEIQ